MSMGDAHPVTVVVQATTDQFGSPLNELARVLQVLNGAPDKNQLLIDLRWAGFIRPSLFLPLAAIIDRHAKRGGLVEVIYPEPLSSTQSYLESIRFPYGHILLSPAANEDDLIRYYHKSYLPILTIQTNNERTSSKTSLTQAVREVLKSNTTHKSDVLTAMLYLVSEALDNIEQHSGATIGWMHVQMYPTKGYADLCICDTGKTILGSYQAARFDEVTDDATAMTRALDGRSVKQTDMGRGFGIRTSRKMLQLGLKGTHFLWSGAAAATTKAGGDQVQRLPNGLHFPGTLVALRIPLKAPDNFSIYDFVEG